MTKKFETTHILLNSIFQMMSSIVYGFGIYTLIERGYSSSVAGLCFSFVNLFSLVLTPILSNYLDNTDKITIFDVIIYFSCIITILYGINYFLDTKSLVLSVVFIIANGLYVTLDPIVNSISSKVSTYGVSIPYAKARSVGSVSYGVICALFGYISSKTSYTSVIIGGIIFSSITILLGRQINKRFQVIKANSPSKEIKKEDIISFKEFVTNNVLFFVLCLFLIGIYVGFTSTDNFMLLVAENVGGSSKDMGYLLAFKAILEGIAMFLFPYFLKRVKLETLLYIAAFGFFAKQLLVYLSPNVAWLYVSQAFQMLSFSIMMPGVIAFVNKYLKEREIIRGISMFTLTIGIGSTISSALAGGLCDIYGVSMLNLVSTITTLISGIGFCVVLYFYNKKYE